MREKLFRGKTKGTGEWVKGNVFIDDKGEKCEILIGYTNYRVSWEVIPETIGQFIGLTDKNGKKIFEGDIVRTQPFYDRPYSSKRKEKQFVGVVEYDIYKFNGNRFYDEQIYDARWRVKISEDVGKYTHFSWSDFWNCEVIGNTHDNPELLQVQRKEDEGK